MTLFAALIGLCFAAFLGALTTFGIDWFRAWAPRYEGTHFPIVAVGKASRIMRTASRTCFTLPMVKLRPARPLAMLFEMHAGPDYAASLPLLAYPTDKAYQAVREDLQVHSPGERWLRYFCFSNPAAISDLQDFKVSGHAEYEMPHEMWIVPEQLPTFHVCARDERACRARERGG